MCVFHHQEPLPLPHNVEPRYDTTVESSGGLNTVVDRHIEERATTYTSENDTPSSSKILRRYELFSLNFGSTSTLLSNVEF